MTSLRSFTFGRDAVHVSGPDAISYLQGQLSQDVAALGPGGSAWSWLLQPAGKVDALVRVTRTGPDSLLVDVDAGYGEVVLNRLNRFKLRTKADLALGAIGVLAVRGPGARGVAASRAAALAALDVHRAGHYEATVVDALWPSDEDSADVIIHGGEGTDPAEASGVAAALAAAALDPAARDAAARDAAALDAAALDAAALDAAALDADGWEAERVAAGVPVMGAELTDRTIPAETGLVEITASFTKGCYTGQELVARIDSRGGNVPRHLRRLRTGAPLATGDELTSAAGKVVGTVTSTAVHPDAGPVALAYLARSVAAGDPIGSPAGAVTIVVTGAG